MWISNVTICAGLILQKYANLQMKIINLSLDPLQRMPGEKSMLYSVTFSSINAQFCNIAFSQMVYCLNWCSYYIPFHLTFIHKLSFSQPREGRWIELCSIYLYPELSAHFTLFTSPQSSGYLQSRLRWHFNILLTTKVWPNSEIKKTE